MTTNTPKGVEYRIEAAKKVYLQRKASDIN